MAQSLAGIAPLLHIGYHKTGTTWLQDHLFNNAEAGFETPFKRGRDIQRLFIMPGPFAFDADACRDRFGPGLRAARERSLVPVITTERLSGNPHSGGYDCREIADRLREVFPDGRVLVVLREQKAMIASSYKQYVRVGGTASLQDYLDPPFYRRHLAIRMPLFQFDYFKYEGLVQYYQQRFGSDGVLILLYEQFRAEPLEFVRRIVQFAGANAGDELLAAMPFGEHVNAALSSSEAAVRRRVNVIGVHDSVNPWVLVRRAGAKRLVEGGVAKLDALVPSGTKKNLDQKMKQFIVEQTGDRFRESNRKLGQLLGVDLGPYGYDV
jgi:hypothetical protein